MERFYEMQPSNQYNSCRKAGVRAGKISVLVADRAEKSTIFED